MPQPAQCSRRDWLGRGLALKMTRGKPGLCVEVSGSCPCSGMAHPPRAAPRTRLLRMTSSGQKESPTRSAERAPFLASTKMRWSFGDCYATSPPESRDCSVPRGSLISLRVERSRFFKYLTELPSAGRDGQPGHLSAGYCWSLTFQPRAGHACVFRHILRYVTSW
jgi:hypothetical protein